MLSAEITVRRCGAALRRPAAVERMPLLARLLLGRGRRRGLAAVALKLARALFVLCHRRLGLPAPGRIALALPDGPRGFGADFANTAYLDFADRCAAGGHEPEVTAFLDAVAGPARIVYDIGANWGYFVAALATNPAFGGHVHAFEIAPGTGRDLARMVADCGLGARATCHPFGLSDRRGTLRISDELHSFLTHVLPDGGAGGTAVPVERLDELDLPDPDIVKIDVEGHEAAVLRGAAARLARARPVVVFESWYTADTAAMLEPLGVLEALGYAFHLLAWDVAAGERHVRVPLLPRGGTAPAATLLLVPLRAEDRPLIPAALNIVAVHPERADRIAAFV